MTELIYMGLGFSAGVVIGFIILGAVASGRAEDTRKKYLRLIRNREDMLDQMFKENESLRRGLSRQDEAIRRFEQDQEIRETNNKKLPKEKKT